MADNLMKIRLFACHLWLPDYRLPANKPGTPSESISASSVRRGIDLLKLFFPSLQMLVKTIVLQISFMSPFLPKSHPEWNCK